MIYDKYRGKNTRPQCVKTLHFRNTNAVSLFLVESSVIYNAQIILIASHSMLADGGLLSSGRRLGNSGLAGWLVDSLTV
jgi:hypothetical protein